MIKDSSVFILDDPLVGLDFKLREQLFIDLREMLSEIEGSVIYTTSDPLETLALADQVFVLDDKHIIESGSIDQIYDEPQRARSLQLLGVPAANLVSGELTGRICQTRSGPAKLLLSRKSRAPLRYNSASGPKQFVWKNQHRSARSGAELEHRSGTL
jgi:multiple sugar transport system ATP-binding protein